MRSKIGRMLVAVGMKRNARMSRPMTLWPGNR
jgi:hypothetical protein